MAGTPTHHEHAGDEVQTRDRRSGDEPSLSGTFREPSREPPCWRPLRKIDLLVGGVTLLVIAAVTWPRLPPGVCFGDSGELQLAAITLGITHAPGYPIYASLGHLFTLIPGVDGAFMVSLACLASGLVALWFCFALQVRLGVSAGVAGALTLALAAHQRTWINLIAPEVYAPTLAFQAGSTYLLVKYACLDRSRDLNGAAVLFGVAVANRPPVILSLPFVVLAWWLARRQHPPSGWGGHARSLGVCALCASLPGFYALGYLYVRDAKSTPYDYIELHDTEYNQVPDLDAGFIAKIRRVWWHVSAREFNYAIGNTAKGVWNKLRWLRREFFLYQPVAFALSIALALAGVWTLRTRAPAAAALLLGMIASDLVFLCAYRMWGQAADYMPLLWSVIVLLGASTTIVFREGRPRFAAQLGLVAWAVMGALTVTGHFAGPHAALAGDAVPFVRQLDLATLPKNSVVCVAWPETPAVFYARYVDTPREDVAIVAAATGNWERMLIRYEGRPIFGASLNTLLKRYRAVPFRNIWRLEPRDK